MNTDLPPAQRVFVIAPHPDDESLGCGGTIARYVRNGTVVNLLVVSNGAALEEPDGQHDDIVAARSQELETATTTLGIQSLHALQLPDSQLAHYETQIRKTISEHLTTFQPDLVLAPSPIDSHGDHVTVGRIALQLFRSTPGWALAFYEVLAPLRFNTLVDITDVATVKEKAIRCYQRSLFQQPQLFWRAFRALNVAKSAFVHRAGLFEALWVLHAPPTDHELLDWITYGFQSGDNGPSPLQRVKDIDDLVFALQEKTRALANAERQLSALRNEVAEAEQKLQEQATRLTTLQEERTNSDTVSQISPPAFPAQERHFVRQYLEYAFPVGSSRRAALSMLKRHLTQYTSKSPKE